MKNHLLILGAGYTGGRLARQMLDRNWRVRVTTRSDERAERLESQGVRTRLWHLVEDGPNAIDSMFQWADALVYSIPSLSRSYRDTDDAKLLNWFQGVLERAARAGVGRFIYLSSTSVYGDHQGAWVDEQSRCNPVSRAGKLRRAIEQKLVETDVPRCLVARLTGIYGPGRTMLDYIESGRFKLVDGGQKPTNRIHVDDIVTGLTRLIEASEPAHQIYNFSDGAPTTVVELVDWLVQRYGIDRPEEVSLESYRKMRGDSAASRWATTYRVDNSRLVHEFDFEPEFADVFEGYRAILD